MAHFGQAACIAKESGARGAAHVNAIDYLADPIAFFDREQEFFRPFLLLMGLPDRLVDTVVGLLEPYTDLQEPVEVDRELEEGDAVDVGAGLEAVYTPGHAPASLCFVAATEGVVFTGDHVLSEISPNLLLTLKPGSTDERTRSLPDYIASLQKLRSIDAEIGYGSHRKPIRKLQHRVREIDNHHQARKERIAEMLAKMGPTTAYQVMQELFPDLPATEMFSGMSEVIGHLDLLEDENRVVVTETDSVKRYEFR